MTSFEINVCIILVVVIIFIMAYKKIMNSIDKPPFSEGGSRTNKPAIDSCPNEPATGPDTESGRSTAPAQPHIRKRISSSTAPDEKEKEGDTDDSD